MAMQTRPLENALGPRAHRAAPPSNQRSYFHTNNIYPSLRLSTVVVNDPGRYYSGKAVDMPRRPCYSQVDSFGVKISMPTPGPVSSRFLRDVNQSTVLNVIADKGPVSRSDLTRLCGLTGATITRIVSDFVNAGLVLEEPGQLSTGGRRPVMLTINPVAGYVVGIKLSAGVQLSSSAI